ncbi:hypothetical protein ACSF6I_14580 [Escherichia coli]|uniref:restriction endonuclease n=1 Tax=Escherichia coli TaxID=562 RepID=UPI003EE96DE3
MRFLSCYLKLKMRHQRNEIKVLLFENLCVQYFLNEPKYAELYSSVLSYSAWVEKYGNSIGITHKKDSGIDLIAVTKTGEFHAIQY